jgi:hypothetical protein
MVHTAGLSLDQARWVDQEVTDYLGALPWSRFTTLVEAKIIAADPDAAEARRQAAAAERYLTTGQSNEYGLKTMIAKANAGDIIFFIAMCDRIADILTTQGDPDPVTVRRAKAVGILANPARALTLLHAHATTDPTGRTTRPPDNTPADHAPATPGGDPDGTEGSGEPIREGDLHPADNDADDPLAQRHPCPACRGAGTRTGDPTTFLRPMRVDPAKLLPTAVVYLHLAADSLTRGPGGLVRFEHGIGPGTLAQAVELLEDCQVTIKPVLDLANQTPVDSYEIPPATREAVHLLRPTSTTGATRPVRGSPFEHQLQKLITTHADGF